MNYYYYYYYYLLLLLLLLLFIVTIIIIIIIRGYAVAYLIQALWLQAGRTRIRIFR
jgi:hypothetical protein